MTNQCMRSRSATAPGVIVAGWLLLTVSLAFGGVLVSQIAASHEVTWNSTLLAVAVMLAVAGVVMLGPESQCARAE